MIYQEYSDQMTAHLTADIWDAANRRLLAKALAELMREDVAQPIAMQGDDKGYTHFVLHSDLPDIYYTFLAKQSYLNFWHIDSNSIQRNINGELTVSVDVARFFQDMQQTFGVDSFTLTHYVEELIHTLYADAYIHSVGRLPAHKLADADFQTIEHCLDGHPWVIVNKGRIGFNAADYLRFTPEADQKFNLFWLAAHRDSIVAKTTSDRDFASMYRHELGQKTLHCFENRLRDKKLDPNQYLYIPVHPWQWQNKLIIQFAPDIARQRLVPLAYSDDLYSPQQSIRTLFNASTPTKLYVKTATSILNTSHIRGLTPRQLSIAPALTEWLKAKLLSDPYLQESGLILLGEVATVSFAHSHFSSISDSPYQYNEFLGVLWRESPFSFLNKEEKPITMAALLYVDNDGQSLVQELILKSGLSTQAWIVEYLNAFLKPILQIYYAHAVCVDPHGQNVIVVLKDNIPVRIALQDFVGDILVNEESKKVLPQEFIEKMFIASPNPENAPLTILIAVFDAFFRYFSHVLENTTGYTSKEFWDNVSNVVHSYQNEHPELSEKFKTYDMFTPEFKRLIFNSRRLYNGYEETSDFPHMKKSGFVPNPLYELEQSQIALKGI